MNVVWCLCVPVIEWKEETFFYWNRKSKCKIDSLQLWEWTVRKRRTRRKDYAILCYTILYYDYTMARESRDEKERRVSQVPHQLRFICFRFHEVDIHWLSMVDLWLYLFFDVLMNRLFIVNGRARLIRKETEEKKMYMMERMPSIFLQFLILYFLFYPPSGHVLAVILLCCGFIRHNEITYPIAIIHSKLLTWRISLDAMVVSIIVVPPFCHLHPPLLLFCYTTTSVTMS